MSLFELTHLESKDGKSVAALKVTAPLLGFDISKVAERALDEASAILLQRIRKRFLAEQDPEGEDWEKSAAGIKRKSGGYTTRGGKKYHSTGTLFETGTLFHSIQPSREGPFERIIYTDVPYALYHQEGTKDHSRISKAGNSFVMPGLPARPFLGAGKDDVNLIEAIFNKHIKEAIG